MSKILEVQELRTYFHQDGRFTKAVDSVSFELEKGGRLGIAGQSGSGKTQTLLSIAGLVDGRPGVISGDIRINGVSLLEGLDAFIQIDDSDEVLTISKDERRWSRRLNDNYAAVRGRQVGLIFQEPKSALVPYQTIERQMIQAAEAAGEFAGDGYDRDRACGVLNSMGFEDPARILASYPHEISGGESQRATIGIVLQSDPELLLADEPTSSLDPESAAHVLDLLDDVVSSAMKSLVLVTHSASILEDMVDHVLVMYAGTIVESGPKDAILKNANNGVTHPYSGRLVEADLGLGSDAAIDQIDDHGVAETGCPYRRNCPLKPRLGTEIQSRCENERPALIEIGPNHRAACWGLGEI